MAAITTKRQRRARVVPAAIGPTQATPCSRLPSGVTRVPIPALPLAAQQETEGSALEKIVAILRRYTGHDFSQYKRSTISRRIERRVGVHQLPGIAAYVRFLQENPQERDLLFKELLIGVTAFFRDPPAWDALKTKVLPGLLAASPTGELRAWVAGSSTGEEAFSLAMIFKEAVAEFPSSGHSLRVFATDLDRDAIARARAGLFPENIVADVSPERIAAFFTKEDGQGFRIRKDIRDMVTLAPQDVIADPPFIRVDLLLCRNLLIYFSSDLQSRLLRLFHYSLNPGGCLFLGSAETVGQQSTLFAPADGKWRLYLRRRDSERAAALALPAAILSPSLRRTTERPTEKPMPPIHTLAEQLLLGSFTPPAVLVDARGDILFVNGHTGKYLEPAAGRANWNLFAMAREGLRSELAVAIRRASRKGPSARETARAVRVRSDGRVLTVDVTVVAIDQPEPLRGTFLVVFTDRATSARESRHETAAPKGPEARALQLETCRLEEELRDTREEMQGSHEELRAANEELQSTNEELQSTNEELTTAKEEMQSLNEELQTVNAELQAKVEELSRANNDMRNLLDSTDIATLFLDEALRVRRFTTQASRLIKLIPGDVGRVVTDVASDLLYAALGDDVSDVLKTLVFVERRVETGDGRLFKARVMPYRTVENRVEGVVVTFTEITPIKVLESELRQARAECERIMAVTLPPVPAPETQASVPAPVVSRTGDPSTKRKRPR